MGITVYKVMQNDDDKPVLFMVESSADDGPGLAANYIQELGLSRSVELSPQVQGKLASIAQSIQGEFSRIASMASAMLDSMKTVSPSEVTLEFGVQLGGKC